MEAHDDPDFFLHKKWRLTRTNLHQDYTYTVEPAASLSKSSSGRVSHRSSPPPSSLRRSSSTRPHRRQSPPPSSPPLMRSLSKKGSAFTRKCTSFAKEQKARFYIIKRCVSMLVRLRKHPDS